MPYAADYKLGEMLGAAGATVGIIISGAILLGGLEAKYVGLFERLRGLSGEERGGERSDRRRQALEVQVNNYLWRIRLINAAALSMSLGLLGFVVAVAMAALSVAYPEARAFREAGALALIGGLSLGAVAVTLNLAELYLSRQAVLPEVEDLKGIRKDRGPYG
jgi:hypothetical protein